MLMDYVCKLADTNGEVAYLEASPVSVSTYRKYDFVERDRVSVMIKGEEYVNLCMVREPQRRAAQGCGDIGVCAE